MTGLKNIIEESLEEDYIVRYVKGTPKNTDIFHFHDLYEIYFSLSDNVNCFINDSVYDVKIGDIFLFKPTDFHKLVVKESSLYERFYILFNPSYIQQLSTEKTNLLNCFSMQDSSFLPVIHLDSGSIEAFKELLIKAIKYDQSSDFGNDVYKRLTLAEILVFINKFYEIKGGTIKSSAPSNYNKINPVIKYIDTHINEKLSLDFLSSTFFISKYYMEMLFKSTTGLTINEYIITKRILKAKSLLRENIPVTQVAELTGFNNYSHFIRTFTKLVHISPKQYAKKARYAKF